MWRQRIRRISMILSLYAIGLLEAIFLPRYGIEVMLSAIGVTAILAGFWVRARWNG